MAVQVTWAMNATIVETLPNNTGSAADNSRKVTHDQFNESGTINSGTTPPATFQASFSQALTAGAATIDLRALTGTNGASVDANSLKVQIVRIKNLGANAMTFKKGASNGHNFFTDDGFTVQPGGVFMAFSNDNTDDVDGTHKTWDVTGTGTQAAEVTIVVG